MSIPLRGVVATATFVLAIGAGTGQAFAADSVPDNSANNVDRGTGAKNSPEARPVVKDSLETRLAVKDSPDARPTATAGVPAAAQSQDHAETAPAAESEAQTVAQSMDQTEAQTEAQAESQPAARDLDSVTERASARLQVLQEMARRQRRALVSTWQRKADKAVSFAYRQQGRPYVWGGTGGRGYDCSGLVQRSWRQAGVSIPRVAADQYRRIRKHVRARELRPGDLVYFDHLGHVGLYVGRGHFIHAPHTGSHVQVTDLNSYWRAHLVGAARPAWPRLPVVPDRLT